MKKILGLWAEWRKTMRTFEELSSLSDRELMDIGISRADIWEVSRRA